MSRTVSTSRRLWILAAMVVAEMAAILPSATWVHAVAAIPLVLLLPGLAIVESLQVDRRRLSFGDALIWSVMVSLGSAVVGGLALNLLGGLTREGWLIYSAVVVGVATFVSVRTTTVKLGADDAAVEVPQSAPSRTRGTGTRINISVRNLVSAALGLVVLGASFTLSYQSAANTRERFTQIWIIPAGATPAMTRLHAQLGIRNHEGSAEHYVVQLFENGEAHATDTWSVTVQDGATWKRPLDRQPGISMRATLAYENGGQKHLQYVSLQPPS